MSKKLKTQILRLWAEGRNVFEIANIVGGRESDIAAITRGEDINRMSKTAALKLAQQVCSGVGRRSGTEYVFYVPSDTAKPNGATSEGKAHSYPKAVALRARCVADVALYQMGYFGTEVDTDVEHATWKGCTSAKAIVEFVVARNQEGAQS